ncbi:hypothetical protein BGW38_004645 [Lunasporangiospora selenospora]|uniref:rhizopuspepsin n=1 Tax=Lunasporangiospora selenospora TaxID=979761 RepID=A0A9P6G0N5_9FUNG|nr:hypothetical protein BGW38_004645 [Lunasporangiospora selenospora]
MNRGSKGQSLGRLESETNLARVPLVDYNFDREYYGSVQIGQPPQTFKIDFDTGSSQFVISAKDCIECSGTTHYDARASSTYKPGSKPWRITYGDLSHAEGVLGRDRITIDGITVENQQLALVTNESAGFDDTVDGIMGLAFGALSTTGTPTKTVFENMMSQKLVERGLFSFYLGKTSLGGGGEVIFGGMDKSRIADGHEVTFTPVTRAKYWQINVSNVLVNSKVIPFRLSSGHTPDSTSEDNEQDGEKDDNDSGTSRWKSNIAGIMDTGTTLMVVPSRLAQQIHRQIRGARDLGQSTWALPCDLAESDPHGSVQLEIEGKRFGIPFEDLVREEADQPGICYSGIQTSTATFMIIGDVFIKNNYVVFDQEHKRVGIAPLKLSPNQTKDKEEESAAQGQDMEAEEDADEQDQEISQNEDQENAIDENDNDSEAEEDHDDGIIDLAAVHTS